MTDTPLKPAAAKAKPGPKPKAATASNPGPKPKANPASANDERQALWKKAGLGAAAIGSAAVAAALIYTRNTKKKPG